MDQDRTFFVVVTFNGLKWIERCLASIYMSNCDNIIIVDNCSTDGTVEFIKSKFPSVALVELRENIGFGAANNIGMKMAMENGCDFVFLLNQDAWIEPDTINHLIDVYKKHPEYGILSPMHVNADYTALDFNFSNYLVPQFCPDLYSDIYFRSTKEVYEIDFVNAAAWLISRKCLETVGFFDSLFYHYCEDSNYCHRVLYNELKIGVCPGTRIVHDRPGRKGVAPSFAGHQHYLKLKVAWLADIRKDDFDSKFKELQKGLFATMLNAMVKGNKQKLLEAVDDYRFFNRMKPEIKKSRIKNSIRKS